MSTNNLYFEQQYKKYQSFLSENFQFLEVKFSIYWNRRVFVMYVLSKNKKNTIYPCKPQFFYIKVGFKGSKLYRHVFVIS